jgi:hypothetical protein
MPAGIVAVLVICKVKISALEIGAFLPAWWPAITWPHYVLIGTAATVAVASLFRTPKSSLAAARTLP